MQALKSLLTKFGRRARARWWIGERPDVRDNKLAEAILAFINLPEADHAPFTLNSLVELDCTEAAHLLAVAGSTSLAFGNASPRSSIVKEAKAALLELGECSQFLGNGKWGTAPSRGWQPLTSATFECGLIGFNNKSAFAFWVEEED